MENRNQYNLFFQKTEGELGNLKNLPEENQKIISQIVELFNIEPSAELLSGLRELSQKDVDKLNHIHDLGLEINKDNIFSLVATQLSDNEIKTLSEYQKKGLEATRDLIFKLISGIDISAEKINEIKDVKTFLNGLGNDSIDIWLKANIEDLLGCYSLEEIENGREYAKFYNYVLDELSGNDKFLHAIEQLKNEYTLEKFKIEKEKRKFENKMVDSLKELGFEDLVDEFKEKFSQQLKRYLITPYEKVIEQRKFFIKIIEKFKDKQNKDKQEMSDYIQKFLDIFYKFNVNMVGYYQLIELGVVKEITPASMYKYKNNIGLMNYLTPDVVGFLKKYEINDGKEITDDFVFGCVHKIFDNKKIFSGEVPVDERIKVFNTIVQVLEKYKNDKEEISIDSILNLVNNVYNNCKCFNIYVIEQLLELGIIVGISPDQLKIIEESSIRRGPLSSETMALLKEYGMKISQYNYNNIENRNLSLEDIKLLESSFLSEGEKLDVISVLRLLCERNLKPYMLQKENIDSIKRYFMPYISSDNDYNEECDKTKHYIGVCRQIREKGIEDINELEHIDGRLLFLSDNLKNVSLLDKYSDLYKAKDIISGLSDFVFSSKCISFVKIIYGNDISLLGYIDIVRKYDIENLSIITDKLMELDEIGLLSMLGIEVFVQNDISEQDEGYRQNDISEQDEGYRGNYSKIGKWVFDKYYYIDRDSIKQLDIEKLEKGMHFLEDMETGGFKRNKNRFVSFYDLLKFQEVLDKHSSEKDDSEIKKLLEMWKFIVESEFLSRKFSENRERNFWNYKLEGYEKILKCMNFTNKLMELKKIGLLSLIGFAGSEFDSVRMREWAWRNDYLFRCLDKIDIEEIENLIPLLKEFEVDGFKWKKSKFISISRLINFKNKSEEQIRELLKLRKYIIEGQQPPKKSINKKDGEVKHINLFPGEYGKILGKIKRDVQQLRENGGNKNNKDEIEYNHYLEDEYLSELLEKYKESNISYFSDNDLDEKKEQFEEKWRQFKEKLDLLLGQYDNQENIDDIIQMYRDIVDYDKKYFDEGFLDEKCLTYRIENHKKELIIKIPELIESLFKIGGLDFVIKILFECYNHVDFCLLEKYCVSDCDKIKLLEKLEKINFESEEKINDFLSSLFSILENKYGKELITLYGRYVSYRCEYDSNKPYELRFYVNNTNENSRDKKEYFKSFLKKLGSNDIDISEIYKEGSGKFVMGNSGKKFRYIDYLAPLEEFTLGGKINDGVLDFGFNLCLGKSYDNDFIIGGGYLKIDPINNEILVFGSNKKGKIQQKFHPVIKDILERKFIGYNIEFGDVDSKPDEYDMKTLRRVIGDK